MGGIIFWSVLMMWIFGCKHKYHKEKHILLNASKKVDLEVNTEENKCTYAHVLLSNYRTKSYDKDLYSKRWDTKDVGNAAVEKVWGEEGYEGHIHFRLECNGIFWKEGWVNQMCFLSVHLPIYVFCICLSQ
jgi:hypothetical protein